MNLSTIRDELAAIGEPFGFAQYPTMVKNPSPPAIVVGFPTDITYGASLSYATIHLPITIVLPVDDLESSTRALDDAWSTKADSLIDAYNGAKSGTGAWRTCRVLGAGNVRVVTLGAAEALGADIELELIA